MTLTQERLKELLHYDPETGDWTWKVQLSNAALIGSSAGSIYCQLGRTKTHSILRIRIGRKNYLAHRLAFLYMLGRWPIGEVDHKNRNPMDFSWKNLREGASRSQQGANKSKRSGTSSRYKGVHLERPRKWKPIESQHDQVWRACIQVNGKMISLGSYANEDEAGRAYNVAAIRYFGEYAVLNENDVPETVLSKAA
jgi:hypothetical protein